uniref:IQ motif and ubiquitin-like domain-containing protein n=1 Tax=Mola mola TaxID=94237 RepID=A0A3Q3XLE0_MOLML
VDSSVMETSPPGPPRPPQSNNMPDVLTVRVQTDEGVFQDTVVEIDRPLQKKAFLGGFRNRLTGVEYHHAAVQTLPKKRPDRGVVVFSRDTQTASLKCQAQQSSADASTQMNRTGCYISCLTDRLLVPGDYVPASECHSKRVRAAIVLQSFARRWLAQQESLRMERNRRLAWQEMQEKRRKEEKEEQLKDRRRRWKNPQQREDFDILYRSLQKWRSEEEQRINSSLRGAERRAALCALLEQEQQCISTIGRQQISAQANNYDKAVRNLLDKCAAPRRWRAADGRMIEMDSQETIRARELRDLYASVNHVAASCEQRLIDLMTLKHTVQEHECQLTRDIVTLIDREVDLMTRRVKSTSLEGLRKRISTLFLQFIKTPAFNPEVARQLKVPQNPSQLKNNLFFCRACHRYLHSDNFSPSTSTRVIGRCRECTGLDNIARTRDDLSCYKTILTRLRADELQLNGEAKIPFLLQLEDMRYLVEVIWASCSALRTSSDLYDLVFVRWERQRDWSPWNCVLLSREEASIHVEVEDETLVRGIKHKHMLGRRHFSQISIMAEYLDSRSPAALGNQLVSKLITMETEECDTDGTPPSDH